jgi:hypothetical protein
MFLAKKLTIHPHLSLKPQIPCSFASVQAFLIEGLGARQSYATCFARIEIYPPLDSLAT